MVVPPFVVAMAPNWLAAVLVLLQLALPPTHATETLPFVMSLKTQAFGKVVVLEGHTLAGVFASPYST
jgi:hypothetical protein